MLKIAICDDNDSHLKTLKELLNTVLSNNGLSYSLISFVNGEKLKNHLCFFPNSIDLIFMDIKLNNSNGIIIAKEILSSFPKLIIIFVTSHIAYARDIFSAKPSGFLVKPIDPEKLYESITVAIDALDQINHNILTITTKDQVFNLRLKLVDYAMSTGRVLTFFEYGKEIKVYAKLDEYESLLGPSFLRCHKSYIVNMDRIQSFDKQNIILYSGKNIPISKRCHESAKIKFLHYLGECL